MLAKSAWLMAVALAACAALATPARAIERPIVYVVVIDGLDGDAVDAGGTPFVSSLLAGEGASATYFRESRSILPAETNPNHVAMMSGAYAGASGIASNGFALYAPLESEDSCVAMGPVDFTRPPVLTTGEDASCLLADTVFSSIKRQGNPDDLLTAGVFGKPKLGRIFAGKTIDAQQRDVDHLWAPCDSGAADDEYCAPVPTNPVSTYALDDKTVMDEVIRTIDEGIPAQGGEARRPDFTFVNLHQVDSAGHAFGRGPVYDAALEMADQEISRLVAKLRERGEWERTVLMLVSDHSMDTTLNRLTATDAFADAGIPEDRFVVVGEGSVALAYVARDDKRFALLKQMREVALAQGAVSEALYREPNPLDGGKQHTVAAVHPEWRAAGPRSGDLLLVAKEGATFSDPSFDDNPVPGAHGGPQTRDNFMAVVGGSGFVRQQGLEGVVAPLFNDALSNPKQSENVDVASTVMGLFGLAAPRNNRGRFLGDAFSLASLPGKGKPDGRPAVEVFGKRKGARCAYRVVWGPRGGRFDVQAGRRGSFKPILRNTRKTRLKRTGPRNLRFRVRLRSASGAPGAFRSRRPRCR